MIKKQTILRSSEWILAGSLSFLLLSVIVVSKIRSSQLTLDLPPKAPEIDVVIDGFVAKPGVYQIAAGAPLGEVLRKARPKRFADLSSLDLNALVKEPVHHKIGKLEVLRVSLEGAITNPGVIEVPVGSRICDLKKFISLSQEADASFLKKRRLLKEGEKISIPIKKND